MNHETAFEWCDPRPAEMERALASVGVFVNLDTVALDRALDRGMKQFLAQQMTEDHDRHSIQQAIATIASNEANVHQTHGDWEPRMIFKNAPKSACMFTPTPPSQKRKPRSISPAVAIRRELFAALPKVLPTKRHASTKTRCSCRRTACLKLYCECYNSGVACTAACDCSNCHNDETMETQRAQVMQKKRKHTGCACKKPTNGKNEWCDRNYCVCRKNGKKCGKMCRCTCRECKNR